jgi:hypothetical protein
MIETINSLFIIKSTDKKIISENGGTVNIGFCQKLRLMTHCFPNEKYKRFLKAGDFKVNKEFDIVKIIKEIRNVHP